MGVGQTVFSRRERGTTPAHDQGPADDQGGHGGCGQDCQKPEESVAADEKRAGNSRCRSRDRGGGTCRRHSPGSTRPGRRTANRRKPWQDRLGTLGLEHARAAIKNQYHHPDKEQLPRADHDVPSPEVPASAARLLRIVSALVSRAHVKPNPAENRSRRQRAVPVMPQGRRFATRKQRRAVQVLKPV